MPLLRAEAEKLSQNQVIQGIIEEIITVNEMYSLLPFTKVDGKEVVTRVGYERRAVTKRRADGTTYEAERSVRIGDNVRVDGFEGRITDITGRYTLIRSGVGRESIVPNELLITQRVENLSLSDPRVWMSTVVSVAYESDVDQVAQLLTNAALVSPRVLRDPAPSAALSAFGADGLEFTVGFWIADPENGSLGLRSDINRAILSALRAHQIEIPYPQRVMHVQVDGAVPAMMSPGGTPAPAPPSAG